MKNLGHLTKKNIIDKTGKRTTVWVKNGVEQKDEKHPAAKLPTKDVAEHSGDTKSFIAKVEKMNAGDKLSYGSGEGKMVVEALAGQLKGQGTYYRISKFVMEDGKLEKESSYGSPNKYDVIDHIQDFTSMEGRMNAAKLPKSSNPSKKVIADKNNNRKEVWVKKQSSPKQQLENTLAGVERDLKMEGIAPHIKTHLEGVRKEIQGKLKGFEKKEKKPAADKKEKPTKVKFLVHEDEDGEKDLFAYFPDENNDSSGKMKTGYSHTGQHSGVHPDYAKESRAATPEEYASLKKELEGLGYNLKH